MQIDWDAVDLRALFFVANTKCALKFVSYL